MAFISKERESTGEDATIPPSFMTYHDEVGKAKQSKEGFLMHLILKDPFASAVESASALHCPDAKRNLLDDLNRFGQKHMMPYIIMPLSNELYMYHT